MGKQVARGGGNLSLSALNMSMRAPALPKWKNGEGGTEGGDAVSLSLSFHDPLPAPPHTQCFEGKKGGGAQAVQGGDTLIM